MHSHISVHETLFGSTASFIAIVKLSFHQPEYFQTYLLNFRSAQIMENCKIIAIANQKGGTGKSTTASNMGNALAYEGKRVLLIDFTRKETFQ